ncbi:hypothetical protein DPMN_137705, partial [Dreissena polymorpha]
MLFPNHMFLFNNVPVNLVENHKHLGLTLSSNAGEICAKSVINFEKVNKLSYEVVIHAYDGYGNSTTETLTLLISDVNEKPEFTTTTWTITKNDEGG